MKRVFVLVIVLIIMIGLSSCMLKIFKKDNKTPDEYIPGTLFPMPDSIVSIKCKETVIEDRKGQMDQYDDWVYVYYETTAEADKARGEYFECIEEHFPDYYDPEGNMLFRPGIVGNHAYFGFGIKYHD